MNYRRIASFTGWSWIITFVTSIPARLFFHAPVLDHEGNYVTGAGIVPNADRDRGLLELLLVTSERRDGRGAVLDPQARARSRALAYVTARLVECTYIAIGIVCLLAISSLRQDAPGGTDAAVGQGIFASMSGRSGSGQASSPASGTA